MIVGDFNIHLDIDADTIRMCDVLSMHDLIQHVNVPTHRSGHTLVIIITRCNRELLLSSPVADYMVSDHMFVRYRVNMSRPFLETRYRVNMHRPFLETRYRVNMPRPF